LLFYVRQITKLPPAGMALPKQNHMVIDYAIDYIGVGKIRRNRFTLGEKILQRW
jgi:hypothetical protein